MLDGCMPLNKCVKEVTLYCTGTSCENNIASAHGSSVSKKSLSGFVELS